MTATVVAVRTAFPEHVVDTDTVERHYRGVFEGRVSGLDTYTAMIRSAGIATRHLVLPPEEIVQRRPLGEKNALYGRESRRLAEEAASRCLDAAGVEAKDVDFLITLSCTGFMIPPLDAFLVNRMGFRADVRRLPVTEMGCAAGAWSLARARELMSGGEIGRILIVSVELPSLTFQPDDLKPANLVSSVLFGDGAAAVLVSGAEDATGLRIESSGSLLFRDTTDLMGFDLEADGFHIVLDRKIPFVIAREARPGLERFLASHGLAAGDLGFWVLHPGGKRILDSIAAAFSLGEVELAPTLAVWSRRGNLSSATVLGILEQTLLQQPPPDARGLAVAFGPGFCMEMVLLRSIA